MEIIYTNHQGGQRGIHIQIADHEIADVLDDLDAPAVRNDLFDAFAATKDLLDLLRKANIAFTADRREAENSQT